MINVIEVSYPKNVNSALYTHYKLIGLKKADLLTGFLVKSFDIDFRINHYSIISA